MKRYVLVLSVIALPLLQACEYPRRCIWSIWCG